MTFFFTLFVIMFFGFALNRLAKLVRIPALVFYLLFGCYASLTRRCQAPPSAYWMMGLWAFPPTSRK